jgi:hypothetical protein
VNLRTLVFGAAGALVMWGAFRKLRRFLGTRVNVTPVSERWLAEQRGSRNEY